MNGIVWNFSNLIFIKIVFLLSNCVKIVKVLYKKLMDLLCVNYDLLILIGRIYIMFYFED